MQNIINHVTGLTSTSVSSLKVNQQELQKEALNMQARRLASSINTANHFNLPINSIYQESEPSRISLEVQMKQAYNILQPDLQSIRAAQMLAEQRASHRQNLEEQQAFSDKVNMTEILEQLKQQEYKQDWLEDIHENMEYNAPKHMEPFGMSHIKNPFEQGYPYVSMEEALLINSEGEKNGITDMQRNQERVQDPINVEQYPTLLETMRN